MNLKEEAAQHALHYVHSGMCLGLGSGSTAAYFIELLGQRLKSGELENISAVPTSEATARRARQLNIPLITLSEHPQLEVVVDGADEVDPQLNLIKGLGRALLREKIVEIHTQQLIIIVDQSKIVTRLGTHHALPVEIVKFEYQVQLQWLNRLGCQVSLMMDGEQRVETDNGNYLALCHFEDGISNAYTLAEMLAARPGIVEHGLFLDMAKRVVVAHQDGVKVLERGA